MSAALLAAQASAAVQEGSEKRWSQLAQVMTLSAGCAILSGGLSAAATKVIAAMAGPAALGLLATLQQIRETALPAASLNGGTALAQGASALRNNARSAYVRTAAILFAAAAGVVAIGMALAPGAVARWAGLPGEKSGLVRGLAIAVVLASAFVFLSALLSALGAARRLALLQLAGPGAMALLAWPAARGGIRTGSEFVWLLGACAAVTVLAACLALAPYRKTLAEWLTGAPVSVAAARRLFSMSGVMLATSLAGSGAILLVRANILRTGGLRGAGEFDAAFGLSMSQASLVLASLQTHYLPTLARAAGSAERCREIRRVLLLAVPVSTLAIATLAAFKPFWLGLAYSPQFREAAVYLRWTLAGDYLKVGSWILSIPMLARADMGVFLASDLASAGTFLVLACGLARFRGWPEAAAMAFVGMHAVHLAIGAAYVGRREGFSLRAVAAPWLAGLALVTAVSVWKWNA